MSTPRRLVLRGICLLGILPLTGCLDLAGDGFTGLPRQTGDQQNSSPEGSTTSTTGESNCISQIRVKLDSVLKSNIDEDSIDPIQYRHLSRGEKQLVEAAIGRKKCIHPNRHPEISLLEGRLKQRNDDGTVYLVRGSFYYQIHYTNGDRKIAG